MVSVYVAKLLGQGVTLPIIAVGVGGNALVKAVEVDGIDPAALLKVTIAVPAALVIAVMLLVP